MGENAAIRPARCPSARAATPKHDIRQIRGLTLVAAALALVILLGPLAPASFAQTTNGRLIGTVQDTSGAVVPNASLTLINIRTDARLETKSDELGSFLFAALPPALYNLQVSASGFRMAIVNNIELNVGAELAQTIKLEIGAATESVVVQANAVTVQTTDAQVTASVTLRDIDTLPQLGRAPITLSYFQPGIQVNPGDPSFSRVNGLRQGSTNSKLDGIDVNDSVVPRMGLSMTANNTDSVGEFRIVLGAGKAEYGRSAGGQIEMITRSGTNSYHGNAFEYLRNTELNANDFFSNSSGVSRPKFIQNIFGGSFGGPIRKEKLFIFGNFQGRRTAQTTVRNRTVYTTQARGGLYRWNSGGATQSFNIYQNDPRGIGEDATIAKILAQIPAPNNFDVGDTLNTAGFRFNNPSGSMEDQFTIRGDYQLTSTNRVFLRWSWQRNSSIDALNNADASYPGQPQGTQGGHRWGFAIGDDWTITPTLINEFRIGYQRSDVGFLRPGRLAGPTVITNLLSPDLNFSGFAQGRWSPVIDLTENLTKVHGKHTFKFGAGIRRTLQHGYNDAGIYPNITTAIANGNIVPSSIGPQGLGSADRTTFEQMYNDLLGRVDTVTQTFYSDLTTFLPAGKGRVRDYVFHEAGYFFQDDWRIKPRLTLNFGIRWEYFLQPKEQNTLQGYFEQASSINGVTPLTSLTVKRGGNWFGNDMNNFAPRLGFAYDVTGNGKTAIRGAYGIFYDRVMGSIPNTIDGATPGFSQAVPVYPNQTNNDIRISDTALSMPASPAAPVLTLPLERSTSISVFTPNFRTGYVQNYSLNLQHELFANTVVEAAFVGNRGIKLFTWRDVNQPLVYGTFLTSFQEMQAYVNSQTAVPASNVFVRLFGSAAAAQTAIGATNFRNGLVGTVANSIDTNKSNFSRYAAAGLADTFLRPYPQFNQVRLGVNDGRSYYNSLQLGIRRSAGALRTNFFYTFSKSIDNVGAYDATNSAAEGNGFASPIDSRNLRLMRGIADFNHTHVFTGQAMYTLPFGRDHRFGRNMSRWLDSLVGGWDLGNLIVWQTGNPYTVRSQRLTVTPNGNTWANYSGSSTHIGSIARSGDSRCTTVGACVFYLTAADLSQFSFPGAGEFGTAGRNTFQGPRFFNLDTSLVKRFRITESTRVTFRAEAYNLFNNPNFGGLQTNLNNAATFGKFTSTIGAQSSNARVMQMTMRFDF